MFVYMSQVLIAQDNNTEAKSGLDGGTIESQFNYVINKSEKYELYQVVKKTWLNKIKRNTLDSIADLQNNIKSLENSGEGQLNEITALKSQLSETNSQLETAVNERDSFSFFGILMSKGSYSLMVWTIVFVLTIGIAVLFFLFQRSNAITIKTKESLIEKQEEFDAHRKWALEREQTLARELNKLKQKYKGLD